MSCWSSCPFCSQQVLSVQLERHANNHFEDQDQNEDIAFDFRSPRNITVDNPIQSESDFLTRSEATTSNQNTHSSVSLQDTNLGFISLLKNSLECDAASGKSTSILSGYVDHFQTLEFEDVGWGCGWRNIQMLSSHLLVQRQEAREVLFGGAGFVPDIPLLQTWLETAWEKGFDVAGSNDFDRKIYGKPSWIGTTECAALFRSFGLRARIVDFSSSTRDYGSSVAKRKKPTQVIGPMDKFLNKPAADAGSSNNNRDECMVKGHQLLANWVWSYFSDNMLGKSSCNQVVVTEKAPLYFQHDGHSRTIVGIQLKSLPNGMHQYNLLILDPAHKTQVLKNCLSKKVGWQRFIKRGVHTLKKPDYQLCYMDPGIATGAEMEKLKILDSTRFEF
ncbi:zinc finger with UFM1-specific peptidase domain protein [Cynara cardunculus var. scolymus]|uniref:zinc finger with UFM1-specific peptidase domain protein n=1 Tax=Cynara cardunculus var. scolymus TaxID=59895 RepID=UPI000D62C4B8|nr:zinc finger with UFM1-specific peptidase domain protein [Cynara cardunculus var. scolymus]